MYRWAPGFKELREAREETGRPHLARREYVMRAIQWTFTMTCVVAVFAALGCRASPGDSEYGDREPHPTASTVVQAPTADSVPPIVAERGKEAPVASPPTGSTHADAPPRTATPPTTGSKVTSDAANVVELRVEVVDASGRPEPDARLHVGWVDAGKEVFHYDGDLGPTGIGVVPGVRPGLVTVHAQVGNLWRCRSEPVAGARAGMKIEIPAGWTVSGTVRTDDGSPTGAVVRMADSLGPFRRVTRDKASSKQPLDSEEWRAVTDDAGRFEFRRVPAGDYELEATLRSAGAASRRAVPVHVVDADLSVPDIVMGRIALFGTVTDAVTGQPVPGAELQVTGPPPAPIAHSDSAGRYQFADLGPGTLKLVIRADGYEPTELSSPVLDGNRPGQLDVRLSAGAPLELVLVDEAGRPVKGEVHLDWVRSGTPTGSGCRVRTDEQGVVRTTNLGAGSWIVGVGVEGYARKRQDVKLPSEGARLTYVLHKAR